MIWEVTTESRTQERRIKLMESDWTPSQAAGSASRFASAMASEEYGYAYPDRRAVKITLRPNRGAVAPAATEPFRSVLWLVSALAVLGVPVLTTLLCWDLVRRVAWRSGPLTDTGHPGGPFALPGWRNEVVFHSSRLARHAVLELLGQHGPATASTIDLVSDPEDRIASYATFSPGTYMLLDFDLALVEVTRARTLLKALEHLTRRDDLDLVIVCRRSPYPRLYAPGEYPEMSGQFTTEELTRWDHVLSRLVRMDDASAGLREKYPYPANAGGLSASGVPHYHTLWLVCTRSERILLRQLATGSIANPRNDYVVGELLAWGLIVNHPWPRIADPGFERFVKASAPLQGLVTAPVDSSAVGRKAIRAATIITLLLVAVGISWAAGNTLRFATGILVAALAFIAQMTQAINLVRGSDAHKAS